MKNIIRTFTAVVAVTVTAVILAFAGPVSANATTTPYSSCVSGTGTASGETLNGLSIQKNLVINGSIGRMVCNFWTREGTVRMKGFLIFAEEDGANGVWYTTLGTQPSTNFRSVALASWTSKDAGVLGTAHIIANQLPTTFAAKAVPAKALKIAAPHRK